MHHFLSQTVLRVGFLLTLVHSGCVALNLPSERYHDPRDHGGIFGSWKTNAVDPAATNAFSQPPNGIDHATGTIGSTVDCIGGESLSVNPFDTTQGEYAKPPEPPEVPWPRFHPVPTRPVFGG